MSAKETIEKYCLLQTRVSDHLNEYHKYAADCFCGKGGYWMGNSDYDGSRDMGYMNDMKSFEFIEQAVDEKIAKEIKRSK